MNTKAISERLAALKVRCIVVVDDAEENLEAIRQVAANFPEINWIFLDNGAAAIDFIQENHRKIDFLITDRQMETPDAGIEVLGQAYHFFIPSIIVSGGFQHAGKSQTRIFPRDINDLPDGMLKDNPDSWLMILERIAEALDFTPQNSHLLLATRFVYRRNGKGPINFDKDMMKLARCFLDR